MPTTAPNRDTKDALNVLLELTRLLAEDAALDHALQAVTDAAMKLFPGYHCSVRMFDEQRVQLLTGARSGEGQRARPMTFRRGEGVLGWVAEHNEVARIDDVHADERFIPAQSQGFEIGSIIALPLPSATEVVGVLAVTAPGTVAFSDDDEMLVRLLANCAVPSLERARLERLAVTDVNTLAYNLRALQPRLAEELQRARMNVAPLSLALLDLDRFKRVNDTFGHAAGDVVLRLFADRVRESVRRPDILVRRGGEEFVLIMPHTEQEQAAVVAERIRQFVADTPMSVGDGVQIPQTVSIGLATWDGAETAEALEKRADLAMYEAKRAGRNKVVSSHS